MRKRLGLSALARGWLPLQVMLSASLVVCVQVTAILQKQPLFLGGEI